MSRPDGTAPESTPFPVGYRELTHGISSKLKHLSKDVPAVMKGFSELASAATADGALDKKTKELIALALAVASHCDGCIGFHVKALIKLGTSRLEIEEALGMAVYMGGGPALMYSGHALACYDEMTAA